MIPRSLARPASGWRSSIVQRRHKKVTEPRGSIRTNAAETDEAGYREITEKEIIDDRPLVADYQAQFEHDLQWDVDEFGESQPFGEYTPYNFIDFSEEQEHLCQHEFSRTINAPMEEVYEWFLDWRNIPPAFDLIDTLIPDDLAEDVAQVMMFYRWRKAPILQLLCTLRRQAAEGDFIVFASDDGMPLVAMIRLGPSEQDPNVTEMVFNVEYFLPKVLVEFATKFDVHMHVDGILDQNLLVCKKLIEKELTLDTLEAWYEEHRTDFYDGNDDPDLKAQLDNIPENFKLEIDMFQDEEDKRQHETFVHNSMAMQELVEEGKYVECEQGWARADADEQEMDMADKATAYYRYFHDMRDKADPEQLANMEEILRTMTYSAGWQGVDGPPDPDSKPFAAWDGDLPHWRGDARREEMKSNPAQAGSDEVDACVAEATAPANEVVEVQDVDDAEVLPPEKSEETPAEPQYRSKFMSEEELESFKGEDDEVGENDPAVPAARFDVDPGPGYRPRDGFVYEGWREAIDTVIDDDRMDARESPEDDVLEFKEIRKGDPEWDEHVTQDPATGEAYFTPSDSLAVDKYQAGGKVTEKEVTDEDLEAEIKRMEDEMSPEEREQYEDFKAKIGRDDIPWNSPYDAMLEDEMLEEYDRIAIVDEDENVVGHAPILSRHDAETMDNDAAHDYMNNIADAAGLREEFEQMKEDLVPKEGLEDEALDDLQDMMDWQTSTAKKMGVTLKEFTDTAVGAQEHAMHDMVDELAGKMGVEPGALMSSAMIFSDRTQRAAEQCGLGHDEFLGAMYEAVEDAEEEDATEAAKLGMDVATYTDWASMIHANSDVKARKLGMTVDEYKAYAWNVVVEARKRDWSDDTEIPDAGSSDEEFDEPPGDADDDSASSEALKQMFGLSYKDEQAMTAPHVGEGYDADGNPIPDPNSDPAADPDAPNAPPSTTFKDSTTDASDGDSGSKR